MSRNKLRDVYRKINYCGRNFVQVELNETSEEILEEWLNREGYSNNVLAYVVDRIKVDNEYITIWGFTFEERKNGEMATWGRKYLDWFCYKRGEDFDPDTAVYLAYMNMLANIRHK